MLLKLVSILAHRRNVVSFVLFGHQAEGLILTEKYRVTASLIQLFYLAL